MNEFIIKKIDKHFEGKKDGFISPINELCETIHIAKSDLLKIIAESSEYNVLFDTKQYSPDSGIFISKNSKNIKRIKKKFQTNSSNIKRMEGSIKSYNIIYKELNELIGRYYNSMMIFDKNVFDKTVFALKEIKEAMDIIKEKIKNDKSRNINSSKTME